jgi:hypothetical protein
MAYRHNPEKESITGFRIMARNHPVMLDGPVEVDVDLEVDVDVVHASWRALEDAG